MADRYVPPEPLEQQLHRLARQVEGNAVRRAVQQGYSSMWTFETTTPLIWLAVPHQLHDLAAWAAILGVRHAHGLLTAAYDEGDQAERLLDHAVDRRWPWAVGRVAGWPGRWVCRVRRAAVLEHEAESKGGAILGVLEVLWGEAGWISTAGPRAWLVVG